MKKQQDKKNIEYFFFYIKGIKSMASDVINYKYHKKVHYCGKNIVRFVFFNYK